MSENSIIEIENLSKAYGFLPVLKSISFEIERGQFVALLGPNGSGKSTLMRLLTGLAKPSLGQIRIGGWDMPREASAVRAQLGLVSHKSLVYDNLTARENLYFYGRLYGLEPDVLEERIITLLKRVALYKRADSLARTFSRGMLQRLSIARALIHDPHILLFDEPYTGLDQNAVVVLNELLQEAHADGHTIVMVTHQLQRAAELAERILILSRGHIGFDELTKDIDTTTLPRIYSEVTGVGANA